MHATINGINLAYDDHGSGQPLLLIHGFPLCRRMWHPQIQAVTAAGYRLIVPDLRGFGESDAPDGPYTIGLFADDLVELLDHLGVEQAVVGGMSMGGYVLFDLLERYPERVRGACFLLTRATADDEAGKERRLTLARDVMRFGPQVIADQFATASVRRRVAEGAPETGGGGVSLDDRERFPRACRRASGDAGAQGLCRAPFRLFDTGTCRRCRRRQSCPPGECPGNRGGNPRMQARHHPPGGSHG